MTAQVQPRPPVRLSARARARLLWLRIHRWIGIGLLLVFLAVGLSGTALVWRDTTERLLHPDRVPVATGNARAAPSQLLAAGTAALPAGMRATQLTLVGRTGAAVLIGEESGPPILGIGPPQNPRIWIDPVDAKLLSMSMGGPDAIFVAKAVHGHLLVAGIGRWLMAASGLMLVISAGTGIYLWWPGLRGIGRSLKWRRQFTRSNNLHRLIGPLSALGLLAQGLTGIFMALPWLFSLGSAQPSGRGGDEVSLPPRPLAATVRSIDDIARQGNELAAGATLASIRFPTDQDGQWNLSYRGGPDVTIDDATGRAAASREPEPTGADALVELNGKLHEGGYGPLHQILLFLTGLAFCMLTITGILHWSQGRAMKKKKARR